jgi:hypothetical protein
MFLYVLIEEVAIFRKSVQRIGNRRLLFLDKTAIHSVMPPRQTHVAPDQHMFNNMISLALLMDHNRLRV